MKTRLPKERLLNILRENKANHVQAYEEAVEGWRTTAIKEIEALATQIEDGESNIYYTTSKPVNNESDYNRAIMMMDLTVEEDITLDEVEFSKYIMDEWDWSRSWLMSNSSYSATAGRLSETRYSD